MDITEQIQDRNKLAELEELEASILETIPHAVIGLRDRRIIFANDGVQAVFGWKTEDLIGKSTRVFYPSDSVDREIGKNLYSTLEKQRTFSMEITCRRKDGSDIECMINASRIGEKLKERGIVITYQDITERNKAKNELQQSREQLRNLSAHLESAREEERTRIARELHDELGQLLTALNTDIILMSRDIPADQASLLEKTKSMSDLIDMTMQTVKRIYMDLRPGMLDHLGLAVAVGWLADEFQKRTGIKCGVKIEPEDMSVDQDLSTAVFRVCQETLTNVQRHAQATKVKIDLKKTADHIELQVRDNGKGITGEQLKKPNSFGLLGIQERAFHRGGEVKISGRENKGTLIKVRMPLAKGAAL